MRTMCIVVEGYEWIKAEEAGGQEEGRHPRGQRKGYTEEEEMTAKGRKLKNSCIKKSKAHAAY